MARGWSREEVEETVGDYLAMLDAELRAEPYSKAEHRRRLRRRLAGRTDGAIELKHGNISAVLHRLGFPSIRGYQPYENYQGLLYEVVAARLAERSALHAAAAKDADRLVRVPRVTDFRSVLTEPPSANSPKAPWRVMERPRSQVPRPPINYLEREARNSALGRAGEEFVVGYERDRLISAGLKRLARRVEHVSHTRGDAQGYDVLSYEESGRERLIEVKTTKHGKATPFFVTANELDASRDLSAQYYLYRVYEFAKAPRLFTLSGAISETCRLDPSQYVATVA